MKKLSLISVALLYLFSTPCFSQNDTIWFDINWKETSKKNAAFYRPEPKKKGDAYYLVDYYLNGAKQMEGVSNDPREDFYIGRVSWYHENGNKFQTANYDKNVLNGNRKVFFENGKLKSESSYLDGKLHGKWKEYYDNEIIKETGSYEKGQKEGVWKTYYINGKLFEVGRYVFDHKVDEWKTNYYDGSEQN